MGTLRRGNSSEGKGASSFGLGLIRVDEKVAPRVQGDLSEPTVRKGITPREQQPMSPTFGPGGYLR